MAYHGHGDGLSEMARGQAGVIRPLSGAITDRSADRVPTPCRPAVVSPEWLEVSEIDALRAEARAIPLVGIAEIDGDHRALIARYDRLLKSFSRHRDVATFALGFHTLVYRTREHFDREERLMDELRYDGYELHRQVHRKLMSDARRHLVDLIGRHERDQCVTVAKWFLHWLVNHVTTHDRKLSESLAGDIWQR